MGDIAFVLLMMLLGGAKKASASTSPTTAADAAADARAKAAAAAAKAAETGHPADVKAAQTATQSAQVLTNHAAAQAAPRPWPQAMPKGLPAFPAGWQFDSPPSSGTVTRAWQLLSTLWAKGSGARKTEQTDGKWITYVATPMGGGKKGVVAYRIRDGVSPTSSATANV